jgi:type IV pilus assembly protein PilB
MITDQLSEMMIRSGRVGSAELEKALAIQEETGRVLTDILIDEKLASSEDIALTFSELLNIPFLELDEDFHLEREEYDLIPESIARRFCLIPLKKEDGVSITIVMKNPLDMDAVDTVRSLTSFEIHKAVSTEERISTIIDKCYKEEAYVESSLQDIVDIEAGEGGGFEGDMGDVDQLLIHANDAPVVRYVNLLLMEAVRDGASDIHFEPGENSCSVRLRVDGSLHPVTPPPKSLFPAIVTRIKILSEMDIAERRLPLDGRFKFKFSGRVVDVRVSSMPQVFGEKVVMRILDKDSLVHYPADGTDRERQDHHALQRAEPAQEPGEECPDSGGSGGIPHRGRQPDADPPQDRAGFCAMPAPYPAPGPGCGDDRGNPRCGNRRDCHACVAHGAYCAQYAAYE